MIWSCFPVLALPCGRLPEEGEKGGGRRGGCFDAALLEMAIAVGIAAEVTLSTSRLLKPLRKLLQRAEERRRHRRAAPAVVELLPRFAFDFLRFPQAVKLPGVSPYLWMVRVLLRN